MLHFETNGTLPRRPKVTFSPTEQLLTPHQTNLITLTPLAVPHPPANPCATAATTLRTTLTTLTSHLTHVEQVLIPDSQRAQFHNIYAALQLPELTSNLLQRIVRLYPHSPFTPHTLSKLLSETITVLNATSATSFLTRRLAATAPLPALIATLPSHLEITTELIEDILHAEPHAPPLDLSTTPHLSKLLESTTPFNLGVLTRLLPPLLDERDIPCPTACSLCHTDWRNIEPSKRYLHSRRSYLPDSRMTRDRNHAMLVSIQNFFNHLTKLISIPPPSTPDLRLVDQALRHGAASLDTEFGQDLEDAAVIRVDEQNGVNPPLLPIQHAVRRVAPDDRVHQLLLLLTWSASMGIDTPAPAHSWSQLEHRIATGFQTPLVRTLSADELSRSVPEREPPSVLDIFMATHQVDVLIVLHALLSGKRRKDVQDALLEAGIVSALSRFCAGLDWADSADGPETSAENAMKEHFIRVLHTLVCGLDIAHPSRSQLFSDAENIVITALRNGDTSVLNSDANKPGRHFYDFQLPEAIQNLTIHRCTDFRPTMPTRSGSFHSKQQQADETRTSGDTEKPLDRPQVSGNSGVAPSRDSSPVNKPNGSRNPERAALSLGDKGLICTVVNIFINTSGKDETSSNRRCLLSGCIETFLRSATLPEKTLIANEGLLHHLIKQISESAASTGKAGLFRQTSFDLLGELIKWNRGVFDMMNNIFKKDYKLLSLLLKAVHERLVDSNVFVRAVVISLEKFKAEDELGIVTDTAQAPYDFENCYMWEFAEKYRIHLIHDLLASVRVQDVNFENICCVNTSLILFTTSCKYEEDLDYILDTLEEMVIFRLREESRRPPNLLALQEEDLFDNYNKLLEFWQSYYRHRGLDVCSLELSSNIHFDALLYFATALQLRLPALSARVKKKAIHIPRCCTDLVVPSLEEDCEIYY